MTGPVGGIQTGAPPAAFRGWAPVWIPPLGPSFYNLAITRLTEWRYPSRLTCVETHPDGPFSASRRGTHVGNLHAYRDTRQK